MAERFQQLSGEKSETDLFSEFTVSDYSFFKSQLFAQNNLEQDELNLFNRMYNIMFSTVKKPDLLIYLHADVEKLQENIKRRGYSIIKGYFSKENCEKLSSKIESVYQRFSKGYPTF